MTHNQPTHIQPTHIQPTHKADMVTVNHENQHLVGPYSLFDLVSEFPNEPWDIDALMRNKYFIIPPGKDVIINGISLKKYINDNRYTQRTCSAHSYMIVNRSAFVHDIIKTQRVKNVSFEIILLSYSFIDWHMISSDENITPRMVRDNINNPWNFELLSSNQMEQPHYRSETHKRLLASEVSQLVKEHFHKLRSS